MASARNVFRRRSELHRQSRLGNQLRDVQTAHVHSEDLLYTSASPSVPTGLFVRQHLDQTVGLVVGARATVGLEREDSLGELDVLGLQLGLRLAHHRDLGLRVHHAGDHIVVDVSMARLDHLRSHRSLLLRLVRQHRAAHDVADGVDVRLVRAQIRVHLHEAALVHLHARLLQTQALRVGHAAHAHQHRLRLQRLLLSVCTSPPLPSPTLAALHAQLHARLRHLAAQHLRAQLELHALLRQALLQR